MDHLSGLSWIGLGCNSAANHDVIDGCMPEHWQNVNLHSSRDCHIQTERAHVLNDGASPLIPERFLRHLFVNAAMIEHESYPHFLNLAGPGNRICDPGHVYLRAAVPVIGFALHLGNCSQSSNPLRGDNICSSLESHICLISSHVTGFQVR